MMKINADTAQAVREATRGLTGRREKDIPFLRMQIERLESNPEAADALRRVLSCLTGTQMRQAAA